MLCALAFIFGLCLGGFFTWALLRKEEQPMGTLYFYEDEPGQPPIMVADLEATPEEIQKHFSVIMKVSHK